MNTSDIQGELLTIRTQNSYDSYDFGNFIKEDYFMNIDLYTKIIFKSELSLLDECKVEYKIVKQFKGV